MTGAGPVGLLAAQVARALRGPGPRHRACPRHGPAGGRARARLRHGDRGRPDGVRALRVQAGADVVIECSGSADGATACLETARRRGPLRPDRRLRRAGHGSARPRVREGARRHVRLRVDAAVVAPGRLADRAAQRRARATRERRRPADGMGTCICRSPGRPGAQDRLRPTTRMTHATRAIHHQGGCSMKIGLFTVLFNDKPLEEVADYAAGLGYEMVELAAWRGSNHFDTDRAAEDISYAKGIKKMLADRGLEISALSNHLSSQMVLPVQRLESRRVGRHVGQGGDGQARNGAHPEDGARGLRAGDQDGGRGFFGSTVWESWYIWPPQRLADLRGGVGALRRALEPDPRRVRQARSPIRPRGASDGDRLQRLHRARRRSSASAATTGASTSTPATSSGR